MPLKLTNHSTAFNCLILGHRQMERHLLTVLTYLDDLFFLFVYLNSSEGQCVCAVTAYRTVVGRRSNIACMCWFSLLTKTETSETCVKVICPECGNQVIKGLKLLGVWGCKSVSASQNIAVVRVTA